MQCRTCGYTNAADFNQCPLCGMAAVSSPNPLQPYPLQAQPNAYSPPMASFADPPPYRPATEGDATGGIIPYKNPKALIAYYLGILSGLPFLGFPFGIAAFILGIMGLRDRNRNPIIKGSIHAGIGIGCGGFFALLWGTGIVVTILSLLSH